MDLPRTHVFLTHNWGTDELQRDNHRRVAVFNDGLQRRGWITWFDSERLGGDIKQQMATGIDNTAVVLVFITARYCEKVACGADDNCGMEFDYAHRRRGVSHMVPIVMEPRMKDTKKWHGQLGMVLGSTLYSDFSDDHQLESCLDHVSKTIMKLSALPEQDFAQAVAVLRRKAEDALTLAPQAQNHGAACSNLAKCLTSCLDVVRECTQVDGMTMSELDSLINKALALLKASVSPSTSTTTLDPEAVTALQAQFQRIEANLKSRMEARARADANLKDKVGRLRPGVHRPENRGLEANSSSDSFQATTPWPEEWPPESEVLKAYLEFVVGTHSKLDVKIAGGVVSLALDDVYISLQGDPSSAFERKQAKALLDQEVQSLARASGGTTSEDMIQLIRRRILMNQPVTMILEQRDNAGPAAANNASLSRTSSTSSSTSPSANVDVRDAVAAHPWLVILGQPGGGKTTVCRFLALAAAREYLGKLSAAADSSSSPTAVEAPLPIMLRISEYARNLASYPELLDFLGAASWFERRPALHGREMVGGMLQCLFLRHLERGKAVVLLDGLDEITEANQRAAVVNAVDIFANGWIRPPGTSVGNQLVVTSRIAGYHSAPLEHPSFVHFTISPLTMTAIERFCQTWMRAIHRVESGAAGAAGAAGGGGSAAGMEQEELEEPFQRARAEADALYEAIEDPQRAGLRELSSSPLLLSALCGMYHSTGHSLPEKRVQIYEYFVNQLIDVWKAKNATSAKVFAPEKMIPILCSVARHIHETSSTGLIEANDVRQEFLRELSKLNPTASHDTMAVEVDAWLRVAREEVGILAAHGEQLYGFVHLTFQEYLASISVLKDPRAVDLMLDRLPDPRWREALVLAVGYASLTYSPEDFNAFLRQLLQGQPAAQPVSPTASSSSASAAGSAAGPHALPPSSAATPTSTELVPRGALVVSMALKEMVQKPHEDIIREALGVILQSACTSEHFSSHFMFVDVAKQLVGTLDPDDVLAHLIAIATRLSDTDPRNLPLALLVNKMELHSQRLVELLWPRIYLDNEAWQWPIRCYLQSHPKDVLLHAVADDTLLPFRHALLLDPSLTELIQSQAEVFRAVIGVYGGGIDVRDNSFSVPHILNDSPLTPIFLQCLEPEKSAQKKKRTSSSSSHSSTDAGPAAAALVSSSLRSRITSALESGLKNKSSSSSSKKMPEIVDGIIALLMMDGLPAVSPYLASLHHKPTLDALSTKLQLLTSAFQAPVNAFAKQTYEQINGCVPPTGLAEEADPHIQRLTPWMCAAFVQQVQAKNSEGSFKLKASAVYHMSPGFYLASLFLKALSNCNTDDSVSWEAALAVDCSLHKIAPPALDNSAFLAAVSETLNFWVQELRLWDLPFAPLGLPSEVFSTADTVLLLTSLPKDLWPFRFAMQQICRRAASQDAALQPWAVVLELASLIADDDATATTRTVQALEVGSRAVLAIPDVFIRCMGLYVLAQLEASVEAKAGRLNEASSLVLTLKDAMHSVYLCSLLIPAISAVITESGSAADRHGSATSGTSPTSGISPAALSNAALLATLSTRREALMKAAFSKSKNLPFPLPVARLSAALYFSTTNSKWQHKCLKRITASLLQLKPGATKAELPIDLALCLHYAKPVLEATEAGQSLLTKYLGKLGGNKLLLGLALRLPGLRFIGALEWATEKHSGARAAASVSSLPGSPTASTPTEAAGSHDLWPYSAFLEATSPMQQAVTVGLASAADALREMVVVTVDDYEQPWQRLLMASAKLNENVLASFLSRGKQAPLKCSGQAAAVIDRLLRGDGNARDAALQLLAVLRSPSSEAMGLVEGWLRAFSTEETEPQEPISQGFTGAERRRILILTALLSLEAAELCVMTVPALEALFDAIGGSDDAVRLRFEASTQLQHRISRFSGEAFFALCKLMERTSKNPVPLLLCSWLTERLVLDDELVLERMLANVEKGWKVFKRVRQIEPELLLKTLDGLLAGSEDLSGARWYALFIMLFQASHYKSDVCKTFSVWAAILARAFLQLGPSAGEVAAGTGDGGVGAGLAGAGDAGPFAPVAAAAASTVASASSPPVASLRSRLNAGFGEGELLVQLGFGPEDGAARTAQAAQAAAIAARYSARLAQLEGLCNNSKLKACFAWVVGFKYYTAERHRFWIDLLNATPESIPSAVLGTALLWFQRNSSYYSQDLLTLAVPFFRHKDEMVRAAAVGSICDCYDYYGPQSTEVKELCKAHNLSPKDLLLGAMYICCRNEVFVDSSDSIETFVVDVVEANCEDLLPLFLKWCFDGLEVALARNEKTNTKPLEVLYDLALPHDGSTMQLSYSLLEKVFAKLPAACNMALKSLYSGQKLHSLLSRAAVTQGFPTRQTTLTILSFLNDLYQIDIARVLAAAAMDVVYVRTAAFEATKRLRSLPLELSANLQGLLLHPSGNTAYFAGNCLVTIATNRRCPMEQRKAIMRAFEAAIRQMSQNGKASVLVWSAQGDVIGELSSLLYKMLIQATSNLGGSSSGAGSSSSSSGSNSSNNNSNYGTNNSNSSVAKVGLGARTRLPLFQFGLQSRKFDINCKFSLERSPFAFYVGQPCSNFKPILMQSLWLCFVRSGLVPHEVLACLELIQSQVSGQALPMIKGEPYRSGLSQSELSDLSWRYLYEVTEAAMYQFETPLGRTFPMIGKVMKKHGLRYTHFLDEADAYTDDYQCTFLEFVVYALGCVEQGEDSSEEADRLVGVGNHVHLLAHVSRSESFGNMRALDANAANTPWLCGVCRRTQMGYADRWACTRGCDYGVCRPCAIAAADMV